MKNGIWKCIIFLFALYLSACGRQVSSPPTLIWQVKIGDGVVRQPPALSRGVVITATDGGPLIALDVTSGENSWQFLPVGGVWQRAFAVDDQRVYIGVPGEELIALDLVTGHPLWQAKLNGETQTPPQIVGNTVYVATTYVGPGLSDDPLGHASLSALSAEDGHLLWSFESDNYALQTPYIGEQTVFVGGSYYDPEKKTNEGGLTRLYAIDIHSGQKLWQWEAKDGFVKTVYATDKTVTYLAYQDFITALDAKTGQLLWKKDTGNWTPAFLGANGRIYFGAANTQISALQADFGDLIWQYNIPEGSFNYVLGAPALENRQVIFLSQQGELMALDLEDGHLCWQVATGITAAVGVTAKQGWILIGDMQGRVSAYYLGE